MLKRTFSSPRKDARWLLAILFWCALTVPVPAARAESMALFEHGKLAAVTYDKDSGVPISKAAELLAHDLNALSGAALRFCRSLRPPKVMLCSLAFHQRRRSRRC